MKAENKIIKCIESCTTEKQLRSCMRMVTNYVNHQCHKITLLSYLFGNRIELIKLNSWWFMEKITTRFYQILLNEVIKK